jgi:hypothetical protein
MQSHDLASIFLVYVQSYDVTSSVTRPSREAIAVGAVSRALRAAADVAVAVKHTPTTTTSTTSTSTSTSTSDTPVEDMDTDTDTFTLTNGTGVSSNLAEVCRPVETWERWECSVEAVSDIARRMRREEAIKRKAARG